MEIVSESQVVSTVPRGGPSGTWKSSLFSEDYIYILIEFLGVTSIYI